MDKVNPLPKRRVETLIYEIRGQRIILDEDLARLYGVATKRLIEQVKRNCDRFPDDFMFRLEFQELASLRSQFATSKEGRGGRRYTPFAFTEHGAIMAASVLNSPLAVRTSVEVVRAFVRLRAVLATHRDLARKLVELERKYDAQFQEVFAAIRQLMTPPDPPKRKIGFRTSEA